MALAQVGAGFGVVTADERAAFPNPPCWCAEAGQQHQRRVGVDAGSFAFDEVLGLVAPYWERVAAWEEWTARRDEWLEQRQLFADVHGWPGGELERLFEECYVFADRPWDPRIESP